MLVTWIFPSVGAVILCVDFVNLVYWYIMIEEIIREFHHMWLRVSFICLESGSFVLFFSFFFNFFILAFRLLGYEGVEVINPEGGKEDAEEEAQRGRWKQEVC